MFKEVKRISQKLNEKKENLRRDGTAANSLAHNTL